MAKKQEKGKQSSQKQSAENQWEAKEEGDEECGSQIPCHVKRRVLRDLSAH
jgi:hypothetical protein